MLEKEEEDFANQVRKQKSFLQSVFREKEELAQLCVNQTAKLSKLETERMEWQRKIIQIEREKRDFLERLDQEKQGHQQSVKKFEKVYFRGPILNRLNNGCFLNKSQCLLSYNATFTNIFQVKRDLDKVTTDSSNVAKERNDAVSQIGQQLKEAK